jgi:ubiquitin
VVYFLEDLLTWPRLVKIGFTTNLIDRIRTLERGRTGTLHILKVIEGGHSLETQLHKRFAAHNESGEWFYADPIRAEIEQMDGVDPNALVFPCSACGQPTKSRYSEHCRPCDIKRRDSEYTNARGRCAICGKLLSKPRSKHCVFCFRQLHRDAAATNRTTCSVCGVPLTSHRHSRCKPCAVKQRRAQAEARKAAERGVRAHCFNCNKPVKQYYKHCRQCAEKRRREAGQQRCGPPSKLTQDVFDRVVRQIEIGAQMRGGYMRYDVEPAGICYATFRNWLAKGRTYEQGKGTPSDVIYYELMVAVRERHGNDTFRVLSSTTRNARARRRWRQRRATERAQATLFAQET